MKELFGFVLGAILGLVYCYILDCLDCSRTKKLKEKELKEKETKENEKQKEKN